MLGVCVLCGVVVESCAPCVFLFVARWLLFWCVCVCVLCGVLCFAVFAVRSCVCFARFGVCGVLPCGVGVLYGVAEWLGVENNPKSSKNINITFDGVGENYDEEGKEPPSPLEQRKYKPVEVKEGDLVTVIDPWVIGESYQGLAVEVNNDNMILYHNDMQRKITWPRRVKCHVIKL